MYEVLCNGKCSIDPGCLKHNPTLIITTTPSMNTSAVKCPICFGAGWNKDPHEQSTALTKLCHGCGGKGWVAV